MASRFLHPDMLAVYVATIAVVLSQLPPLWQLLERPKPSIEAGGVITVAHDFGQLYIEVPVTILNSGGKPILITGINCIWVSSDDAVAMQVTHAADRTSQLRSWSPTTITSNSEQVMTVVCAQEMPAAYYAFRQAALDKVISHFSNLSDEEQYAPLPTPLPSSIVDDIIDVTSKNMPFTPGHQMLSISLVCEPSCEHEDAFDFEDRMGSSLSGSFRDLAFCINSATLDGYVRSLELYRHGFGLFFDQKPGQQIKLKTLPLLTAC